MCMWSGISLRGPETDTGRTSSCLNADHGEEDAKLRVHIHVVSVSEDEVFATLLLAGENYRDLLSRHRQNRQVDAVEFVKTAPRARLRQAWKSQWQFYLHFVAKIKKKKTS